MSLQIRLVGGQTSGVQICRTGASRLADKILTWLLWFRADLVTVQGSTLEMVVESARPEEATADSFYEWAPGSACPDHSMRAGLDPAAA